MKKAFITGITGQDGSYLADLLLSKKYEVHALVRRSSVVNRERLEHIYEKARTSKQKPIEYDSKELGPLTGLHLHYGDLTDASGLHRLIESIAPDEIYNLGAQSHVGISFDMPVYTGEATGIATTNLLEAIRDTRIKTKFYQASSSEMFGGVKKSFQNEKTPFHPRSPYGVAKLYSYWITVNYREAYGIHASNGILFNHESPRRGTNFVTRKITAAVADILAGKRDKLYLGNLDAKRDWGYAPEYVEAMWLMLQQDKPDDYVIATGETHTVREFVEEAFKLAGIDDWDKYVVLDKRYKRPSEVDYLRGDSSKARRKLGWKPKVKFKELVRIMLEHDCKQAGITLPRSKRAR